MKEFSIPLKKNCERPIIELYNLPTLIDTAAVIPVFSIDPDIIAKYFETKLIVNDGFIEGFGGYERGAVYSISEFKIGELTFKNLEVFVPHEPRLKFPFLLSATLFYGMEYAFDTINGNFIVRMTDEQNFERDFKLKELRGKLYPQIDGILIQDVDSFLRDWYLF